MKLTRAAPSSQRFDLRPRRTVRKTAAALWSGGSTAIIPCCTANEGFLALVTCTRQPHSSNLQCMGIQVRRSDNAGSNKVPRSKRGHPTVRPGGKKTSRNGRQWPQTSHYFHVVAAGEGDMLVTSLSRDVGHQYFCCACVNSQPSVIMIHVARLF